MADPMIHVLGARLGLDRPNTKFCIGNGITNFFPFLKSCKNIVCLYRNLEG